MILIIGLGNPGVKYQNNRHNVGQLFIDYLTSLEGLRIKEFKSDKFSNSQLAKLVINNNELIFAKPQTFMNNSGIAVGKLVSKLKLINSPNSQTRQINNLIIVHDDLDIPLSKFHIQFGVGPQLHNGLESIEQHLKTKGFYRVRIGVDNRQQAEKTSLESLDFSRDKLRRRIPGETYALQNFLSDEKKLLKSDIFPKIFAQFKLQLKNKFNILV